MAMLLCCSMTLGKLLLCISVLVHKMDIIVIIHITQGYCEDNINMSLEHHHTAI